MEIKQFLNTLKFTLVRKNKKYRSNSPNRKDEEDVHGSVCDYVNMVYPDVIFTSDASGLRLAMGLRKRWARLRSDSGLPDLMIFEPRGKYCGLFLELKKADDDTVFSKKDGSLLKNKHTIEQAMILDRLKYKGYATYFAIGSKAAIDIIEDYMSEK